MSKRFTRNIKDTKLKGNPKEPLYTNNQNDLLSDDKDAYIRNQDEYHCLTDNIKSLTTDSDLMSVKKTGKNSRQIVFKDDEVVKQEEFQEFKDDDFNPLVDIVHNETVKQDEFQEFKDDEFNPLVEKVENISNNDDGFTKVNQLLQCRNVIHKIDDNTVNLDNNDNISTPYFDISIIKEEFQKRIMITLNNINIQYPTIKMLFIKNDEYNLFFNFSNEVIEDNQITYYLVEEDSNETNKNSYYMLTNFDGSEKEMIQQLVDTIQKNSKLFIEGYNINE